MRNHKERGEGEQSWSVFDIVVELRAGSRAAAAAPTLTWQSVMSLVRRKVRIQQHVRQQREKAREGREQAQ